MCEITGLGFQRSHAQNRSPRRFRSSQKRAHKGQEREVLAPRGKSTRGIHPDMSALLTWGGPGGCGGGGGGGVAGGGEGMSPSLGSLSE